MRTRLRAAAPAFLSTADLGPLQDLPGTWMGSGLSIAELPDHQGHAPFRLRVDATREILTFTEIGAPISNRGNGQGDIVLRGLHYLQQVCDARTNEALHVETGMWLFVPPTSAPIAVATIVRTATVPHGAALLAQGTPLPDVAGAPDIPPLDSTPIGYIFGDGDFPPPDVQLPPGVPDQALRDPTVLLTDALKEQTVIHTTTLDVRTGRDDIRAIGFLGANAAPAGFESTYWIETLSGIDGVETLQLQYSQQTTLRFSSRSRREPTDWPHIQVATLVKQ